MHTLTLPVPAERCRPEAFSQAEWSAADCRVAGRLCEWFAGCIVEKPMGYAKALLQTELSRCVANYLRRQRLGILTGADGPIDFGNGHVLLPDLAFVPWHRCPGGRRPTGSVSRLIPTVVAEVLSDANTAAEMAHKRSIYFAAGVCQVWEIDLQLRIVLVYTPGHAPVRRTRTDALDGGADLPGLVLPLVELFAVLDEAGPEPDAN
jgi:Uma2 family endonuclease